MEIRNTQHPIGRQTRLEIDLSALQDNAAQIAKALGKTRLMAVVKADAYGHGLVQAARAFLQGGASCLSVAIPEEGAALREAGIAQDILVMGAVSSDGARLCVQHDLIQTAHSIEAALFMQSAAKELGTARAHIKIETGMHRLGVYPGEELSALLSTLDQCTNVRIEGIYTHFAAAGEDPPYTKAQNERFLTAAAQAEERLGPLSRHASNSAAVLAHPEARHDIARAGLSLYGCSPYPGAARLTPAMRFVTAIAQIHTAGQGETVGYGRAYTTKRPTRVATIPVGYGDGYPRAIGGRGYALVHEKPAPVIGRVCMDQAMLDVTDIDASVGDEVVLLGQQGNALLPAEALAQWCDTISYEILLRPTARVRRVYLP